MTNKNKNLFSYQALIIITISNVKTKKKNSIHIPLLLLNFFKATINNY